MKRITLALLLLPTLAFAKPTPKDVKDAQALVATLAENAANLDDDTRTRLLLQGCSENAACAGSCDKGLSAAAQVEESQRGPILAALSDECSNVDFKQRHDKDKTLTPQKWTAQFLAKFLDACAPLVPKADQAAWKINRKKAKL